MYGTAITDEDATDSDQINIEKEDIEADIREEIQKLRELRSEKALFQPVRIDIQCGKV